MAEEKPKAAFVLSLVAGIFILLGGGMRFMLGSFMGAYEFGMIRGYGGFGGMMGYGRYPLGVMGTAFGVFGVFGLIFGAIVIISAAMLNKKPAKHTTWGTVVVVFSALHFRERNGRIRGRIDTRSDRRSRDNLENP